METILYNKKLVRSSRAARKLMQLGTTYYMSTKSSPTITTIPCILYAILARESDWAVIFRSGPKRRVQLIRWNTKTDKFDHGQWLKHKVFERQADLSPCGDKLICMSTYYRKADRELHRHLGPILIVSRPPYFTAAAIIKVSQSQESGYFQTNKMILIPQTACVAHPPSIRSKNVTHFDFMPNGKTFTEIDALKLAGWTVKYLNKQIRFCFPLVATKAFPNHSTYQLQMEALRKQPNTNNRRYTLLNTDTGEEAILGDFSWADIDKNNDLLFAKDGQLFRLKPHWSATAPFYLTQAKLLYDFRPSQFTEIEAPSWATEWD